ncbi:MAG: hypothetical protein AAGI03_13790 [Pseudomonadota bacterium]
MKRSPKPIFAIAAFSFASMAMNAQAEEAYKWPLCDDLPALIEAGKEATPFKSLSDRTQLGESMGYRDAPAGLEMESDKRRCFIYVAGSPEGVVGGGKYNKIECVTFRSPFGERMVMSEVIPKRAYLGGILGTCEALQGWDYQAPVTDTPSRYNEDIWTDPESGVQVVAQLEESRSRSKSRSTTFSIRHEVKFIVRNMNPTYVDPDEAFRAMQAKQAAEAGKK